DGARIKKFQTGFGGFINVDIKVDEAETDRRFRQFLGGIRKKPFVEKNAIETAEVTFHFLQPAAAEIAGAVMRIGVSADFGHAFEGVEEMKLLVALERGDEAGAAAAIDAEFGDRAADFARLEHELIQVEKILEGLDDGVFV